MHVYGVYLLYPPENKTATEAYLDEVLLSLRDPQGFSHNGTKFKNPLSTDIATQLIVECKMYPSSMASLKRRI